MKDSERAALLSEIRTLAQQGLGYEDIAYKLGLDDEWKAIARKVVLGEPPRKRAWVGKVG